MKTLKLKQVLYKTFATLTLVFTVFGCSKNNTNSTTPLTYNYQNGICYASNGTQVSTNYCSNASVYQYQNGVCVMTITGQQVPTTYCSNATNSQYIYQNGVCIMATTGQQVPSTYCSNSTNSQYIYQNGLCIMATTGQQVPTTYCSNSGTGTTGKQCVGYYSDGTNSAYCNGTNCHGSLYEYSSGQYVQCL